MSSLHMTFNTDEEWGQLSTHGFLQRMGIQYHWYNSRSATATADEQGPFIQQPYDTFDDFLMDLKQSKRKAIRQVRHISWKAP